jgi:hypothetical protein
VRKLIPFVAGFAVLAGAGASSASAPPVGKLPPSPVTTISTVSQELFAFALPRGRSGLVWRGKSNSNPQVAKPLTEADVGDTIVLVYLAGRPGVADVTYGLTNGEHLKAYRGARFHVIVKPRR